MASLKAELDLRDKELRAKQNEVTELNLLLVSHEKKAGNTQAVSNASGTDILQHPEYKRLLDEVSKTMEELQKSKAMQAMLQDDYKTSAKKSKALMTQLMSAEELNS